jgi:hypothetical protein
MRARFLPCLGAAVLAVWSLGAGATPPPLSPGLYVTDGGWGQLKLQAQGGNLAFKIDTVGGNGHTCGVEGVLKGQNPSVTLPLNGAPGPACEVHLQPLGPRITVSHNGVEACRSYCGARAGFDGDYLVVPKGCAPAEQNGRRQRFRVLFDSQNYVDALKEIQTLLNQCGKQLGSPLLDWVRNDTALTQYKLGDKAACLATLKTVSVYGLSDNAVRDKYPPTDAENLLGVARATRTNLRLCNAAQP